MGLLLILLIIAIFVAISCIRRNYAYSAIFILRFCPGFVRPPTVVLQWGGSNQIVRK